MDFSLRTKSSEHGMETWQVYLVKITTGALVAFGLWLVSFANFDVIFWGSIASYVTSKVCYFINTKSLPDVSWSQLADWVCDGVLTLAWLIPVHLMHGERDAALLMVALLLVTYPWSKQ